jgi:hypothetical protein
VHIITLTGVLGGIISVVIVVIIILVIAILIRLHKNRDVKNQSQFITIISNTNYCIDPLSGNEADTAKRESTAQL